MIFIANGEGVITKIIAPEPIYQNSHKANEIILLAPFNNASVAVAFTLPNGVKTSLNFATPNMAQIDLTGIQTPAGQNYNAWRCMVTKTITEYVGQVEVQFYVYNGTVTSANTTEETANLNLHILATMTTTFSVIRGVKYIPPTADTESEIPIYDQVMGYLSELEKTIAEGGSIGSGGSGGSGGGIQSITFTSISEAFQWCAENSLRLYKFGLVMGDTSVLFANPQYGDTSSITGDIIMLGSWGASDNKLTSFGISASKGILTNDTLEIITDNNVKFNESGVETVEFGEIMTLDDATLTEMGASIIALYF